ncbi:MAG: hypothetical protein V2A73_13415, partial [Pseudomonadota bacterium]
MMGRQPGSTAQNPGPRISEPVVSDRRERPFSTLVLAAVFLVFGSCAGRQPIRRRAEPTIETSLAAAEAYLAERPTNLDVRREVGILAWMNGDSEKAERELARTLAARPTDVLALFALATIYDEWADDSRALDSYQRVVELAPYDQWAEAALGHVLQRIVVISAGGRLDFRNKLLELSRQPTPPRVASSVLQALSVWVNASSDDEASKELASRTGCVPSWLVSASDDDPAPHLRLLAPPSLPPPPSLSLSSPASPPFPSSSSPSSSSSSSQSFPGSPPFAVRVVRDWPRLLPAPRCETMLRSHRGRASRYVLDSIVTARSEAEAELVVRVEDPDAFFRLWLGDTLVLRRDTARRFLSWELSSVATLPRGSHRLLLEAATLGSNVRMTVMVRDPRTGQASESILLPGALPNRGTEQTAATVPEENEAGRPVLVRRPPSSIVPEVALASLPGRQSSIELLRELLLAQIVLSRYGDADAAMTTAERLLAVAPRWIQGYILQARSLAASPSRPPQRQVDDMVRRILAKAMAVDPARAIRLRLMLAEMSLDEGKFDEVLEELDDQRAAASPRRPDDQRAAASPRRPDDQRAAASPRRPPIEGTSMGP